MQLHDNIIEFIETEAKRRGWISPHTGEVSCADLERELGFTRATWSRILRKKQQTIKDNVVTALLDTFDISPIDLLELSIGARTVAEISAKKTPAPPSAMRDRFDQLAEWLRSPSTSEIARNVIFSSAEQFGFNKAEHTSTQEEVGLRPGLETVESFIAKQNNSKKTTS